jgi:drug/metabolite transporter, DME family
LTANTTNTITNASGVVLFAGVLCGTTGTALTRLAPYASALSAGAMRLVIGGITLAGIAAAKGRRPSELTGHRTWLAAGAVAVALYQICFFTGTSRTGVALATVIALGSAPVFSGLINAIILRRPPTMRWAAGTALAVVGIALIARSQPTARTDLGGILAALAAGLGWAVYAMIAQRRMSHGLDSTSCMAAMFTGGAILSAPLLAVGNTAWMTTRNGIGLSVYLGVVTIGVVYTCLGWGLGKLPAPTVLTLTLAEPMTAAILASIVLHQTIGTAGWIGVAALLITARSSDSRPAAPTNPSSQDLSVQFVAGAAAAVHRDVGGGSVDVV